MADFANGDTGVSESGNHNDTDETDDSADAAFYSGYVSDRMRPQNQVAWGNGKTYNRKTCKTIYFSETMRPRALIFCVMQFLVSPFIIPASRVPGVQIGHAPGTSLSSIGL